MKTRRTLGAVALVMALLGGACSSDGSDTASDDSTTTTTTTDDTTTTTGLTSDTAEPVATTEPPDDTDTTTTTTTTVPEPCTAEELRPYYVDVSLDDPDGGLNMRTGPGVENDIVDVFPRSKELIATGVCANEDTWWEVMNSDASLTGWVASRFLVPHTVYNPGLGVEFDAPELVGTEAETLEDLAWLIAAQYGHEEDETVEMVGEPEGEDAIGGFVTFETNGLKDDAVSGYVIFIRFEFVKGGDNASEIVGYRATEITLTTMCSRGVADDLLCV